MAAWTTACWSAPRKETIFNKMPGVCPLDGNAYKANLRERMMGGFDGMNNAMTNNPDAMMEKLAMLKQGTMGGLGNMGGGGRMGGMGNMGGGGRIGGMGNMEGCGMMGGMGNMRVDGMVGAGEWKVGWAAS